MNKVFLFPQIYDQLVMFEQAVVPVSAMLLVLATLATLAVLAVLATLAVLAVLDRGKKSQEEMVQFPTGS